MLEGIRRRLLLLPRRPPAIALAAPLLLLVGGALSTGCRGTGCDLVESELRAREEDVRTLRENLDRSELHNQLLLMEMFALRGEPLEPAVGGGRPVKPSEPYPVRSIRLGRQTAARGSDTCPGWDDTLQVLLEPIDCEGQAIKAPGSLAIEVLEAPDEGGKRPLSAWEIPPEELRGKWQSGLFTTGYSLSLPWKVWPSTSKLRVTARFRMLNGRVFEADKDITVRVAPESRRPAPVLPPTGPLAPSLPGMPHVGGPIISGGVPGVGFHLVPGAAVPVVPFSPPVIKRPPPAPTLPAPIPGVAPPVPMVMPPAASSPGELPPPVQTPSSAPPAAAILRPIPLPSSGE